MQKSLNKAPPRLQRMLLKLQKYDLTVTYVKRKELHVADTLSRAYLATHEAHNADDLDIAVHAMIQIYRSQMQSFRKFRMPQVLMSNSWNSTK